MSNENLEEMVEKMERRGKLLRALSTDKEPANGKNNSLTTMGATAVGSLPLMDTAFADNIINNIDALYNYFMPLIIGGFLAVCAYAGGKFTGYGIKYARRREYKDAALNWGLAAIYPNMTTLLLALGAANPLITALAIPSFSIALYQALNKELEADIVKKEEVRKITKEKKIYETQPKPRVLKKEIIREYEIEEAQEEIKPE